MKNLILVSMFVLGSMNAFKASDIVAQQQGCIQNREFPTTLEKIRTSLDKTLHDDLPSQGNQKKMKAQIKRIATRVRQIERIREVISKLLKNFAKEMSI